MLLKEIFDSTYDFEVEEINGDWLTYFMDDTNNLVGFIAESHSSGAWNIHFKRKGTWNMTNDKASKNIGIKILGTVLKILKKFIAEKEPKALMFSSKKSEESRISLYSKMVEREAAKSGYVDCTSNLDSIADSEQKISDYVRNSIKDFKEHEVTLLVRKDLVKQS